MAIIHMLVIMLFISGHVQYAMRGIFWVGSIEETRMEALVEHLKTQACFGV